MNGLSKTTRFEVFKRDRFTCHYCGRTPPEVKLEADHIHPRASGGTDEIENLITSCADCNRGKGARLLEDGTAPVVNRESIEDLQERVEQAHAYMDSLASLRNVQDEMLDRITEAWAESFGAEVFESDGGTGWRLHMGQWPQERSIRYFLRKLPLEDILSAIEITAGKFNYSSSSACRYFYGICHSRIRER